MSSAGGSGMGAGGSGMGAGGSGMGAGGSGKGSGGSGGGSGGGKGGETPETESQRDTSFRMLVQTIYDRINGCNDGTPLCTAYQSLHERINERMLSGADVGDPYGGEMTMEMVNIFWDELKFIETDTSLLPDDPTPTRATTRRSAPPVPVQPKRKPADVIIAKKKPKRGKSKPTAVPDEPNPPLPTVPVMNATSQEQQSDDGRGDTPDEDFALALQRQFEEEDRLLLQKRLAKERERDLWFNASNLEVKGARTRSGKLVDTDTATALQAHGIVTTVAKEEDDDETETETEDDDETETETEDEEEPHISDPQEPDANDKKYQHDPKDDNLYD